MKESELIGGVHDLSSLVASLRHKGKSIADVTQDVMGYRAKMLFASLAVKPQIVIPVFGLIPIAETVHFIPLCNT